MEIHVYPENTWSIWTIHEAIIRKYYNESFSSNQYINSKRFVLEAFEAHFPLQLNSNVMS